MPVFFSDAFTRADSTVLGNGWVEDTGDWSILANALHTVVAGICHQTTAPSTADYDVEVTLATYAGTAGIGPIGRVADANNFYLVHSRAGAFELWKVVGGAFTLLGSSAVSAGPGQVVKLSMAGTTIVGYSGGVAQVTVTDASLAAIGSAGCRSDNTAADLDNFTVYTAGGTTFTVAVAGSLSSAGGLAARKVAVLTITGVLTSAGTLSRQALRRLDGAQASSGSLLRQASRGLSGALSASGVLVRVVSALWAGTLTSTGAVSRTVARSIGGVVASAGSLTRQAGTRRSGALASSGSVVSALAASLRDLVFTIGAPVAKWTLGMPFGKWALGNVVAKWRTGEPRE